MRPQVVLNFSEQSDKMQHEAAPRARGMRISVNLLNAANDRQEVRSSAGKTPLQYQAGYRDPIGRTFELELRKVF